MTLNGGTAVTVWSEVSRGSGCVYLEIFIPYGRNGLAEATVITDIGASAA